MYFHINLTSSVFFHSCLDNNRVHDSHDNDDNDDNNDDDNADYTDNTKLTILS